MFRSLSTAVLLFLFALPGVALAQGTGTIAGQVLEDDGVTTVIGGNVRVEGTSLQAVTDIDGNYRIIGVPVGTFSVTASFTGYASQTQTGVDVNAGSTRQLNFTIGVTSIGGTEGAVVVYEAPLIQAGALDAVRTVTGADLENLPIRGVAQTVALQGGIVSTEGSNDLNIRGGRAEEVQYIVDGVRITAGASTILGINQQAIEQQEVIIGTIPARYGDVQSGVVSITTKTGRSDFFGSAEAVTSTGLDSFGYNLGSLSLGGPIVRERLGFFLSAEVQRTDDANPYGVDTFTLPNDCSGRGEDCFTYESVQANPQVLEVDNADGTTSYIPFPFGLARADSTLSVTDLQAALLANGTLSAGQTISDPNLRNVGDIVTASDFDTVRGKNDPLRNLTLNGNLNFTFGDIGLRLGGNYTTQNRTNFNLFQSIFNNTGFATDERDSYRVFGTLRQRLSNSAFYQIQGEFQDFQRVQYPERFGSDMNNIALYGDNDAGQNEIARRYYVYRNGSYQQLYTEDSGSTPTSVTPGTFALPGANGNLTYFQAHNQQYRVSASATAQVGVSQIEFGGEFQQETRRQFQISGFRVAGLLSDSVETYAAVPFDQLDQTGIIVSRYGYDYNGLNEVDDEDINTFFAGADGSRGNTNVAPYRPIYYAGYVQDKIEFQDLVVQLGLRVDVFDNNAQVLKDVFAIRPIFRVSDVRTNEAAPGDAADLPGTVEDDYAVYYNTSETIVGFRDTDGQFYNAGGSPTSPEFVLVNQRGAIERNSDAPLSSLFEQYEAQVTVMPRVGVSFPVTDRALFFASYNVTSQRPTEQSFSPFSAIENITGSQNAAIANSNLLPERTTQYEIGFRQRLGERAAISLSGFYRTQENKISQRTLPGANPSYTTYLNADFSTTQGAEFNFDLRRIRNLQITANYTLSFAQGTGSDANSTATATRTGIFPDFISPADFDQRHTANLTLDYRLGEGDGPRVGNVRPFENFGVNVIGQFGSGQRYTRNAPNTGQSLFDAFQPSVIGTLNGSTLPATTRLDLRVDRAFDLGFSDSRLRAYVQVQNLLNTRNQLAVYRSTGQSDSDGFLNTGGGTRLTEGQAFLYQAYAGGPIASAGTSSGTFFYSAPRQIRLGFLFDF